MDRYTRRNNLLSVRTLSLSTMLTISTQNTNTMENSCCTKYEINFYGEYSIILFHCGARIFFHFIHGDLPIRWAPFIDAAVSPEQCSPSGGRPPCPHQAGFYANIPLWCLKEYPQFQTPCWLVIHADVDRTSPLQQWVASAREIKSSPKSDSQQPIGTWSPVSTLIRETDELLSRSTALIQESLQEGLTPPHLYLPMPPSTPLLKQEVRLEPETDDCSGTLVSTLSLPQPIITPLDRFSHPYQTTSPTYGVPGDVHLEPVLDAQLHGMSESWLRADTLMGYNGPFLCDTGSQAVGGGQVQHAVIKEEGVQHGRRKTRPDRKRQKKNQEKKPIKRGSKNLKPLSPAPTRKQGDIHF